MQIASVCWRRLLFRKNVPILGFLFELLVAPCIGIGSVVMGMPVPLAIAEAPGRVMDLAERRQQSVIIALIDPLVTL
jgi:hypothetical protein